jgi:predicted nucleic acid-binding protein
MATMIEPIPPRFRFRRDPDDEPYLNLAIHGDANYLVTRDLDLLDLAGHRTDESGELQRISPRIRNVDPITLLKG